MNVGIGRSATASQLGHFRGDAPAVASESTRTEDTFQRVAASAEESRERLPMVVAARRLADTTAMQPIAFGSTRTLEHLSQFAGTDARVTRPNGRYDGFECAAASLVAGLVMLGRERLEASVPLMLRRHYQTLREVERLPGGPERTLALRELCAARGALERCHGTSAWTLQDLRAFMRATYRVLRVGEWNDALASNKPAPLDFTTGLQDSTVLGARDDLWGCADILYEGRAFTLYAISYEKGGGHAVLAERVPVSEARASLLFDPLPDADGTAATAEDADTPELVRTQGEVSSGTGAAPMDEQAR